MANPLPRVFNALNGEEVRKIIISDIEKHLSGDADFRQHLTYRSIEYVFELRMRVTTTEPRQVKATLKSGRQQVDPASKEEIAGASSIEKSVLSGQEIDSRVKAPDRIREESGLHIPRPQITPTGEIVDIPLEQVNKQHSEHDERVTREAVTTAKIERIPAKPAAELVRDVAEKRTVEVRKDLPQPPRATGVDTGVA